MAYEWEHEKQREFVGDYGYLQAVSDDRIVYKKRRNRQCMSVYNHNHQLLHEIKTRLYNCKPVINPDTNEVAIIGHVDVAPCLGLYDKKGLWKINHFHFIGCEVVRCSFVGLIDCILFWHERTCYKMHVCLLNWINHFSNIINLIKTECINCRFVLQLRIYI